MPDVVLVSVAPFPRSPGGETAPASGRPTIDRPAVLPIGGDELPDRFAAVLIALKQGINVRRVGHGPELSWPANRSDASRSAATAFGNAARPAAPTAAYCELSSSWALADQGISSQSRQAQFVFNSVQKSAGVHRRPHPVEELRLQCRIVEEPPAGAGVDDADLAADHAEPLRGRLLRLRQTITTALEPMCFSSQHDLRDALGAVVGERLGGMLQKARSWSLVSQGDIVGGR